LQYRNIKIVYDQPTSIYTMTYIIETNASVNLGCEIMARKTLPAEDKLGIVVNFRVKLDEYKKLEELAERTGESVGQFVRSSVLNRYNFY